jgi:hypothetical protein
MHVPYSVLSTLCNNAETPQGMLAAKITEALPEHEKVSFYIVHYFVAAVFLMVYTRSCITAINALHLCAGAYNEQLLMRDCQLCYTESAV